MASLTVTKNYQDGSDLTEQQLDDAFDSIETFVNDTKLNSDNIQSGGVAEANIANGAVSSSKLAVDAVTTVKIADSAVTTAKLNAESVTTAKLADENVTVEKLASILQNAFVPTGSVLAYVGATAPTGFLLCDGSAVSRSTYSNLFSAIGDAHGEGDGSTTFNVPDYRGRFLRGVDGGVGRDPDRASRTAMNTGGNTGDSVGSVQGDEFKSHSHLANHSYTPGSPMFATGFDAAITTSATQSTGGNETRPKNANVNYIIKI